MASKKATTKELIQAATINRVVDRQSGRCLGYLVKSNSTDAYYQIVWSKEEKAYQCSCPARVTCCHVKALQQVLAAKKEIARANNLSNFFAALASYSQQQVAEQAVAEAEQVVQPPHRYCESCSCALPLQLMDGLMLCEICAEATRPVTIQTPTPVAVVAPKKTVIVTTKPLAVAKKAPTVVNKANAPLNSKTFSLTR